MRRLLCWFEAWVDRCVLVLKDERASSLGMRRILGCIVAIPCLPGLIGGY
jgi:hypothetical protein